MADNVDKLRDTRHLCSSFRKATEILREQTQPKFTTDSTSKPIFFPLNSVPVPQPNERIFTSIESDLPYTHSHSQELFEIKDTIYFERQSQSSIPNFTECPNAMVNHNKGGFIKASALTNEISQKHEVNTKITLLKTNLNPSPDTENLPQFGEVSQQTTNDSGDFYQSAQSTGHNVLTNPFLFNSILNRVPSLPLPRWRKKRHVPNQTIDVGDESVTTLKLDKVPASTVSLFKKKKMSQLQTQRNINSFIKVSARENFSKSYDEQFCIQSIRSSRRFRRKVSDQVGSGFSSISMHNDQPLSFCEDYSDNEEKQSSLDIIEQQQQFWSSSSDEESPEDYNLFKSYYGLFGSDSSETSTGEEVYFQKLPDELKRIIFCQLPAAELFEVCSKVCKDWRRIIYDEKVSYSILLKILFLFPAS